MASLPVSANAEIAALLAAYDTQLRGQLTDQLPAGVHVERDGPLDDHDAVHLVAAMRTFVTLEWIFDPAAGGEQ
jgi:hypothetical protein